MQSGQRGLLEREQIRALWDLEAERQECSLQPCRQEMEPGLAKSPAICMWRWERKVVRFDCLPCRSHASDHVLRLSPFLLSVPITKAVKIQAPGFLFPAWPRLAPPGPASPPPPPNRTTGRSLCCWLWIPLPIPRLWALGSRLLCLLNLWAG